MPNSMKVGLFFATMLIAMTTSLSLFASDTYQSLDKNKDGVISRGEASADMDLYGQWKDLDTNKDNKLDEAEFSRFETEPEINLPEQEKKTIQ